MHFAAVDARQRRPVDDADALAGHRAVRLVGDDGRVRGELLWRLATGNCVEVTEFGIGDPADRRQGWGTQLLAAGLADARAFFAGKPYRLRRAFLFCDANNAPTRRCTSGTSRMKGNCHRWRHAACGFADQPALDVEAFDVERRLVCEAASGKASAGSRLRAPAGTTAV